MKNIMYFWSTRYIFYYSQSTTLHSTRIVKLSFLFNMRIVYTYNNLAIYPTILYNIAVTKATVLDYYL